MEVSTNVKVSMFISAVVLSATTLFAAPSTTVGAVSQARRTAEALNAIGLEKMSKGDLSGATMKFEEALAVDPSCIAATHNLGKVLSAAKQYDKAISVLEKALELVSDDKGCIVQLVQIYALKGDKSSWRRHLEKAAALPDRFVLRELPILLLRQGSVEAARDAADMALDKEKENPICWFNNGLVSEAEKDVVTAETNYTEAVRLKPDYLAAWVNLGNAFDAQGKAAEATNAYKKAYECDSTNSFAQYNYGRMLVLGGVDVAKGFHLLKIASENDGGASAQAKNLVARLVALANEGGAK